MSICPLVSKRSICETRWTFFRVKLVFEYDFEISWSFGLWDHGTFRPMDLWILGLLNFGLLDLFPIPPHPHTFSYLLISSSYYFLPPPTLSYHLLSLPASSWFGMDLYGLVWFGMGGGCQTRLPLWYDFSVSV